MSRTRGRANRPPDATAALHLGAVPTGGHCCRRALCRLTPNLPPYAGGCEGNAMLNRTNRTLSAHLNRLNLGTRSLAPQASFDNGDQTLYVRHAHPVVMRAGMVGYRVGPNPIGRGVVPFILGSPSVSPWLIASSAIHPGVIFAADASSLADTAVRSFDLPCYRTEEPVSTPTRLRQERGKTGRKPTLGKRRQQGSRLAG